MDEQAFFHPPKFLDQNDSLIEHFWSLVGFTGSPLHSAWLLAMNQVAAAHPGLAPLLPIGSHDPAEQRGVEFLGSSLNVLRVKPMDSLIERLHMHTPDLVHMCGKYLHYNLESVLLRLLRRRLGFPPEPPFRWRGEYLTRDNPIWVGPYSPEHTIEGRTIPAGNLMITPAGTTTKHAMQALQYGNAFRPAKRPGRPRKAPGTPRTPRTRPPDPLAQQAAALAKQYLHWRVIAQQLWPGEPPPTEHKGWDRLRKRVGRLVFRGRLDERQ